MTSRKCVQFCNTASHISAFYSIPDGVKRSLFHRSFNKTTAVKIKYDSKTLRFLELAPGETDYSNSRKDHVFPAREPPTTAWDRLVRFRPTCPTKHLKDS